MWALGGGGSSTPVVAVGAGELRAAARSPLFQEELKLCADVSYRSLKKIYIYISTTDSVKI